MSAIRFATITLVCLSCHAAVADDDLIALQQDAIRAAADTIKGSVVQIETLGSLESSNALVSGGPSTGLIISADGYIVSSAFSFVQKPNSILVSLGNGKRLPAEIVARDRSRMTVLLKINADEPLPVPVPCERDQILPGQTVVAIGKTYSKSDVSVSVGIVSAVNRIWGRAAQTDANVSPANYGGPLVDLHGRVIGVLVPLSPQASNEMAGADLYDSGIGFAVPLTDILTKLPDWQQGQDLAPGRLGVSLDATGLDPPAKVEVVKLNSPAAKAGMQQGDRIVSINGQPIQRLSQLRHALGPLYAEDLIQLKVNREGQLLELELKLVDKVPPYAHAFLGILPGRDPSLSTDEPNGLRVATVFPGSPAARAGIATGDRIVSVNEQPTNEENELRVTLANLQPGDKAALVWMREDQTMNGELQLGNLPEEILDAVSTVQPPQNNAERESGQLDFGTPEDPNQCAAYVPASLGDRNARGLLVLINAPEATKPDDVIANWKSVSEDFGIVLLVPQPADPSRWQRRETDFIRKVVDRAVTKFNIDRQCVGILGTEVGGRMGLITALRNRNTVRAVGLVDVAVSRMIGGLENEPLQRLAFLMVTSLNSDQATMMRTDAQTLRTAKFPVTQLQGTADSGKLTDEQRVRTGRWLVTLNRL